MKRNKSFESKNILYLVSTPIGNLNEVSKRTLDVLNMVDEIYAEDTRNSSSLLSKLNISKPMFSLREHNEKQASLGLIEKIKAGKNIAYMSDAGYPGISDPGAILVQVAIENDIPISVISGSSAFLTALIPSGMNTDHFYFYGFLPPKDGEATTELKELVNRKETLIFYESPHRIIRTLELLNENLGNRKCCLARELTKINEEYIRGTLEELTKIEPETLKGEMVIIVEGKLSDNIVSDDELINRYNVLVSRNIPGKTATEIVSEEFKVNKNRIKDLVMNK